MDWEAFDTGAEAEARAQQLVRFSETYTIEERDERCPRCTKTFHYEPANPSPTKDYPWQQTVRDAVNELDAYDRRQKIGEAQSAISARLAKLTPADTDEQAAIRDALRTLCALRPKRDKPKDESAGNKEIA